MCPAQRDSLAGHFFASQCPLRQSSNFAMSATFPIEGRRDFIAGHFMCPAQWDSLTGRFFASCVPCINFQIFQCRQLFQLRDAETLLPDTFMLNETL